MGLGLRVGVGMLDMPKGWSNSLWGLGLRVTTVTTTTNTTTTMTTTTTTAAAATTTTTTTDMVKFPKQVKLFK